MDCVEDSLTQEVNRIRCSRDQDMVERQRPITTGVLEVKKAKALSNKKNIDYVDTAEATAPGFLRPRAPMAGRRRVRDSGDGSTKEPGRVKEKGGNRKSRSKKSNSITDLWDSLHHFSKNNMGRTLTDQVRYLTICFVMIIVTICALVCVDDICLVRMFREV